MPLDADWEFQLGDRRWKGALKSWSDYGLASYSGTVTYRQQFDLAPSAMRRDADPYLDLGEVRYSANVRLNGQRLGERAWRPFRWPVGKALKAGANLLEIEVTNTAANELAGSPERLAEIEKQGWLKNSYSRIYLKFDAEMVPSGLMGPVRLVWPVPLVQQHYPRCVSAGRPKPSRRKAPPVPLAPLIRCGTGAVPCAR